MHDRMDVGRLQEGAIYSLGLTPYQYTARGTGNGAVPFLLMPEFEDSARICGPTLYVTAGGQLGRKEGLTGLTVGNLDFTGRYNPT